MKRVHKKQPDEWEPRIEKKLKLTLEKPPSEDAAEEAIRAACRRGPNGEYSNQPILICGYNAREQIIDRLAYWPATEKIGLAVLKKINCRPLWQFKRGDKSDMATSGGDEYFGVAEALFYWSDEQDDAREGEPYYPGQLYQLCRTFKVDALQELGTLRLVESDASVMIRGHSLQSRVHVDDLHTHLYSIDVVVAGRDD